LIREWGGKRETKQQRKVEKHSRARKVFQQSVGGGGGGPLSDEEKLSA
jgi:hypothetical protein